LRFGVSSRPFANVNTRRRSTGIRNTPSALLTWLSGARIRIAVTGVSGSIFTRDPLRRLRGSGAPSTTSALSGTAGVIVRDATGADAFPGENVKRARLTLADCGVKWGRGSTRNVGIHPAEVGSQAVAGRAFCRSRPKLADHHGIRVVVITGPGGNVPGRAASGAR